MTDALRTNPAVRFSWPPDGSGLEAEVGCHGAEVGGHGAEVGDLEAESGGHGAESGDPEVKANGTTTRPIADPEALAVLDHALEPRSRADLVAFLTDDLGHSRDSAESTVADLAAADLLVPDDDRAAAAGYWVEHGWDRSLLYYLATTRWEPDVGAGGNPDATASDHRDGSGPPQAAVGTASEQDPPDVALPDPRPLPDRPVNDVLLERRTTREFAGESVPAETMASVLHHATEPVREARLTGPAPGFGYFEPARFPVGIYPVPVRTADVERAVYRYRVDDHGLDRVTTFDNSPEAVDGSPEAVDDVLQAATVNQPWVRDAAFALLVTVDLGGFRERHPDSAALRYLCTLVSGHAHRLVLAAVAYGLAVFQAAALDEPRADDLVGADGFDESTFYVVTVGRAADD